MNTSDAGPGKRIVIYTMTLSPSLDRTIDVEEFVYDDVNVIVEQKRRAGGRGIDVSRVIRQLGGQSVAFGFMGGYNGLEIEGWLTSEGIVCDFTRVNGETRENIVVHQRKKKTQTLLGAAAAEITPFDLTTLHGKIRQIPKGSLLVISGKMPPGCSESFYAQIITSVKDKNIRVFLDTDGEALKKGFQAGPYLCKPNIHEFGRLVEKNIRDPEEIIESLEPFLELSDCMVVSMGARGAVGVSRNERYHVMPPKVTVKSSIGAGDALMAGIVLAISEGVGFKDALVFGVACGTASTLTAEPALCCREDVEEVRKNVLVRTI
jgi:6-phosphofructokinase 2